MKTHASAISILASLLLDESTIREDAQDEAAQVARELEKSRKKNIDMVKQIEAAAISLVTKEDTNRDLRGEIYAMRKLASETQNDIVVLTTRLAESDAEIFRLVKEITAVEKRIREIQDAKPGPNEQNQEK